jgi:hypothetical protein
MLNRYGLVLPRNAAISHSHFTPVPYSEPIFMVMAIHASLFTEGRVVSFQITKYEETKKVLTTGLH